MKEILTVATECSLCGQISPQTLVGATEQLGLPDLDTRPPESLRSTLPFWVKRCPYCGYCARDIDLDFPLAAQVIQRPAYITLLRKRTFPESARNFLAWAMIQEANAEFLGAGWSALHAAWACDDAGKDAAALYCRQQALQHFEQARLGDKPLPGFEDAGAEEIFLADVNRRARQFEQAITICRRGLHKFPTPVVARTLEHEIILAAGSDAASHSLSEVVGLVPGLMN
jgi:hypothetical protein